MEIDVIVFGGIITIIMVAIVLIKP